MQSDELPHPAHRSKAGHRQADWLAYIPAHTLLLHASGEDVKQPVHAAVVFNRSEDDGEERGIFAKPRYRVDVLDYDSRTHHSNMDSFERFRLTIGSKPP